VFLVYVTVGGPRRRSMVLRRYGVLALTVAAIAVLFAVTPTDPSSSAASPRHFQRVYSSPYIWVYLSYLAFPFVDVIRLSRRFTTLSPPAFVRLALRIAAVGGVCGVAYVVVRASVLAADELGADLADWEARVAAPLYLVTASLMMLAATIPSWGPPLSAGWAWLGRRRRLHRLRPLWQALHAAYPEIALLPPTSSLSELLDPRDVDLRLYRRVIEIRDGQLALWPYLRPEVVELARRHAQNAGLAGCRLGAAVVAASIAAALAARADAEAGAGGFRGGRSPPEDDPPDLDAEAVWLEAVSHAFATSPVPRAVLRDLRRRLPDLPPQVPR
jgi:hypothetical protein